MKYQFLDLYYSKILCTFAVTDSATLPIRTTNQGGISFLYTFMPRIPYTKTIKTFEEQIEMLKSRGLQFS